MGQQRRKKKHECVTKAGQMGQPQDSSQGPSPLTAEKPPSTWSLSQQKCHLWRPQPSSLSDLSFLMRKDQNRMRAAFSKCTSVRGQAALPSGSDLSQPRAGAGWYRTQNPLGQELQGHSVLGEPLLKDPLGWKSQGRGGAQRTKSWPETSAKAQRTNRCVAS